MGLSSNCAVIDARQVTYTGDTITCIGTDVKTVSDAISLLGALVCNFYDALAQVQQQNSITVEAEDGDPSYSGIITLQFDEDSGFVITQPSSGKALISLESPNVSEDLENFPYTGFVNADLTYTYDTSDLEYFGNFILIIDNNYEFIVSDPGSLVNLVAELNALNLGTFTINGSSIDVTGPHEYGLIFNDKVPTGVTLQANFTYSVENFTISLDGSLSTGQITSWQWKQDGTLVSTTIGGATINVPSAGDYEICLVISDGLSSDTYCQTVNVPEIDVQVPPIADAGADQIITLPTNQTTISAAGSSDPDGVIVSYLWQKLPSSPSGGTIANAFLVTTTIGNFQEGVYTYRVTVTDNDGLTASSIVQITVNAAIVTDFELTTTNTPVNESLHSIGMQDISFLADLSERDVLTDTVFKNNLLALNAVGGGLFPDAAASRWFHYASGGSRDGYNGASGDFSGTPDVMCDVVEGVLCESYTNDFFEQWYKLCNGVNIPKQLIANMQNGGETELLYQISVASPEMVFFGTESGDSAVNAYWCPTPQVYLGLFEPLNDAVKTADSSIKTVIDAISPNPSWVQALATGSQSMNYDYVAINDHAGKVQNDTGNPFTDLAAMHQHFQTGFPQTLRNTYNQFGNKKLAIAQTFEKLRSNYPSNYYNTIFSTLLVANYYIFFVNQQLTDDNIAYASFSGLKDITDDDDSVQNEYYAVLEAGKLFQPGARVCSILSTPTGTYAAATKGGLGYNILITNENNFTVDLDTITLDGTTFSEFTYDGYHASSVSLLNQTLTHHSGTTSTGVTLQPYSVYNITVEQIDVTPPVPDFDVNKLGLLVNFVDTSTADEPILTYHWDFGDNTSSGRYLAKIFGSTTLTSTNWNGGSFPVDIYEGTGDVATNRAAFIWLIGSGETITGQQAVKWASDEMATRGYVGFIPKYSLSSDPAQGSTERLDSFKNVCLFIKWVQDNAVTYGVDPTKIFLMGFSAGAITTVDTCIALNDRGDSYFSGVYTGSLNLLAGATINGAARSDFATTTYLNSGVKPVFFSGGTADTLVKWDDPNTDNDQLGTYQKMETINPLCNFHWYEGAGHTLGHHNEVVDDVVPYFYSFMSALNTNDTSTDRNPTHLYDTPGTKTVTLTITTATSSEAISQDIIIYEGMQRLFGVSVDGIGSLYNDYATDTVWNNFIATVPFKYGTYQPGAESLFSHFQSFEGWPTVIPAHANVGMRANVDEVHHWTGKPCDSVNPLINCPQGSTKLQKTFNETGVDFYEKTKDYVENHNEVFIYTANVCHGSVSEAQTYMNDLKSRKIPFIVMYGSGELSTAASSTNKVNPSETGDFPPSGYKSMTSAEYIAAVTPFDNMVQANFPNATRILSSAKATTASWINADIASFGNNPSRNIKYFSQYLWIENQSSQANITNYFNDAITNTQNSIDNDLMDRIDAYSTIFSGMRLYIAQGGIGQKAGFLINTMMDGIITWNFLFEIWKFNNDNSNFVQYFQFLVNENAVDKFNGALDNDFSIEPQFKQSNSQTGKVFVKRVAGVCREMLKDIANFDGDPVFIPVSFTGSPDRTDAVCFKLGSKIMLYVYNLKNAVTIQSIDSNAGAIGGNVIKNTLYSSELWGSIGGSAAHSHFKALVAQNPSYVAVDAHQVITTEPSTTIAVQAHSISSIELLSLTDSTPTSITIHL